MKKLSMTLLSLVVLTTVLSAKPMSSIYYTSPKPVGGMEALQQMTKFPALAQEARLDGEVVLSFRVTPEGKVTNVKIVKSGGAMFDEVATQTILNTKWEPARVGEKAVPADYILPFEFRN